MEVNLPINHIDAADIEAFLRKQVRAFRVRQDQAEKAITEAETEEEHTRAACARDYNKKMTARAAELADLVKRHSDPRLKADVGVPKGAKGGETPTSEEAGSAS